MPSPTYVLAVDLGGDELFDASDVLTADVVSPGGEPGATLFEGVRGHDMARVLSQPRAGEAAFLLDNTSGNYSAGGTLVAGRAVRLRATYSGTTYDLMRGILDRPQQQPFGHLRRITEVRVLGSLSRLARRKVSTALYSSITIGTALGHLLDAAGYAKNAQAYVTDLSPAGHWGLGEASGNALDISGNGNDATVTLGAGTRDTTALDDAGDGALTFSATRLTVAAAASIEDIWDGGGTLIALIKPGSGGESNEGRIAEKNNVWIVDHQGSSGSDIRLRFIQRFSGTDGVWVSGASALPLNTLGYAVALTYDADAVGNNPTIRVVDLDTGITTTLTVGSGLTGSTTPVGTRTSDTGQALTIGNHPSAARSFDGPFDEFALFSGATLTTAQVKAWAARAMDAPRHIDAGKTTMDYWWLDDEDAFAAFNTLKATEGPGCSLYEDGTGAIVFKDRHARVTDTRSTVSQTTFSSLAGATEPLLSLPFEHDDGTADVVNACAVDVQSRTVQASQVVWTLGSTVTLAPGETRQYTARGGKTQDTTTGQYIGLFTAAVAPTTGGGDYTEASGALASAPTLDRTSGAAVTITLIGGAAGASITGLRLRAQPVTVAATIAVAATVDVAASQALYGVRSYPLAIRAEIPVNTAQDLVNAIVGYQQNGRATARITVRGIQGAARLTAALAREVSDRVTIVNAGAGVNGAFYVESIAHKVKAPAAHITTFDCEEATATTYFILDTSALDGVDVLGF